MKNIKVDEMKLISRAMKEKESVDPNSLVEKRSRLLLLAKDIGSKQAANYAYSEMAMAAIEVGRYTEAIQILENQLAESPLDIQLNTDLRMVFRHVNSKLHLLATNDPGNPEYGRAYEKLVEFGYVSLESHLGAIRHYVFCSYNIPKAVKIAKSLLKIAPATAGLKLTLMELAKVSDDTFIQQQCLKMKENA